MVVDQNFEPRHFTWFPNDIEGMCEMINWLDTAPNKEVLGWLTIGEGARVFTITDSNRHLWRSILFEVRAYESLILLEKAKLIRVKKDK
tara:strand:- start:64 stop:330 length:267 start_codon:yes stop_codon:yes gene_type:complete